MNGEFAHFIKTDELIFKHARGKRYFIGKEFHTFHEVFLFLGGEAEITSDTMQKKLEPNSMVLIPRGKFHQFTVKTGSEYERSIFNFGSVRELDQLVEKKFSEVCVMPVPCGGDQLERLHRAAAEAPDELESKILAKAVLAELLCLVRVGDASDRRASLNPLIISAVDYIDRHLSEPLRIEDIAAHLHISPSYLMKLFKSRMHISVYKYITEKRLVFAARQMRSGVSAAKAASLAGFTDYTSFFRLYKASFGMAPSKTPSTDGI